MTTIRAAGTLDLTVHRRDPDVRPRIRPVLNSARCQRAVDVALEATGHAGATICGRTLELDELWIDYRPEPRDDLCPRCFTNQDPA